MRQNRMHFPLHKIGAHSILNGIDIAYIHVYFCHLKIQSTGWDAWKFYGNFAINNFKSMVYNQFYCLFSTKIEIWLGWKRQTNWVVSKFDWVLLVSILVAHIFTFASSKLSLTHEKLIKTIFSDNEIFNEIPHFT